MTPCRRVLLPTLLLLTALAPIAGAQTCTIGVYADSDGLISEIYPVVGEPLHAYVVLFTENVVNAVSFHLVVQGLNDEIFVLEESFGPSGDGFSITTPDGYNVALGECAVGFGELPVVVLDLTLILPVHYGQRSLYVEPNPDESPEHPVVSDCASELHPCEATSPLILLGPPLAGEAVSFGQMKSLYRD